MLLTARRALFLPREATTLTIPKAAHASKRALRRGFTDSEKSFAQGSWKGFRRSLVVGFSRGQGFSEGFSEGVLGRGFPESAYNALLESTTPYSTPLEDYDPLFHTSRRQPDYSPDLRPHKTLLNDFWGVGDLGAPVFPPLYFPVITYI